MTYTVDIIRQGVEIHVYCDVGFEIFKQFCEYIKKFKYEGDIDQPIYCERYRADLRIEGLSVSISCMYLNRFEQCCEYAQNFNYNDVN